MVVTLAAAVKFALPACEPVIVQEPTMSRVTVAPFVPVVVHIVGVVETKVSGNADVAEATRLKFSGEPPNAKLPGDGKLMVCEP